MVSVIQTWGLNLVLCSTYQIYDSSPIVPDRLSTQYSLFHTLRLLVLAGANTHCENFVVHLALSRVYYHFAPNLWKQILPSPRASEACRPLWRPRSRRWPRVHSARQRKVYRAEIGMCVRTARVVATRRWPFASRAWTGVWLHWWDCGASPARTRSSARFVLRWRPPVPARP